MTGNDARRVIVAALDAATYQVGNPIVDVSVVRDVVFVKLDDGTTWQLTTQETR